jgi:hypothetical protein
MGQEANDMHPTIDQILVTDHHRSLRAEADHARLVATARAHARATMPVAPVGSEPAQRSLVRRLFARLAIA